MTDERRRRLLPTTALTRHAVRTSVLLILSTAAFLVWHFPALPVLLPVHFRWNGVPDGWQFKTTARVLMPVFVQTALLAVLGGVATLLLSRRDDRAAGNAPDIRAALTASEAVMLMATIWVGFQAYAAVALVAMWTNGRHTLGLTYSGLEVIGLLLTAIVGVRAHAQLGRPDPLPYIAAHWRLGQLYCNAEHPALFVPTREGRRWTLNFGRPAAVVLLGGILAVGIVLPVAILALALRT